DRQGKLLAASLSPRDLDDARAQEIEREAGLPLFVDGLAVAVGPLVGDLGEPLELRGPELVEEAHLPQEVQEVAAPLARGRLRRGPEDGERGDVRRLQRFRVLRPRQQDLSQAPKSESTLHRMVQYMWAGLLRIGRSSAADSASPGRPAAPGGRA